MANPRAFHLILPKKGKLEQGSGLEDKEKTTWMILETRSEKPDPVRKEGILKSDADSAE
jgi:hypothetical protein